MTCEQFCYRVCVLLKHGYTRSLPQKLEDHKAICEKCDNWYYEVLIVEQEWRELASAEQTQN